MIKTNFMDECENCPHLELTKETIDLASWAEKGWYEHIITCEHIEKCKDIKDHLRKEMQKDGNY